jgi:hypothetical protein
MCEFWRIQYFPPLPPLFVVVAVFAGMSSITKKKKSETESHRISTSAYVCVCVCVAQFTSVHVIPSSAPSCSSLPQLLTRPPVIPPHEKKKVFLLSFSARLLLCRSYVTRYAVKALPPSAAFFIILFSRSCLSSFLGVEQTGSTPFCCCSVHHSRVIVFS